MAKKGKKIYLHRYGSSSSNSSGEERDVVGLIGGNILKNSVNTTVNSEVWSAFCDPSEKKCTYVYPAATKSASVYLAKALE